MDTGSTPPKGPAPSDDVRRIRLGVSALGATAHIFLGSFLVFFSEQPEFGPNPSAVIGLVFIVVGLFQKLIAFAEWIDVTRRAR